MEKTIKIKKVNAYDSEDLRKAALLDYLFSKEMAEMEDYWEGPLPSPGESQNLLIKQSNNSLTLLAETPEKAVGYLLLTPGRTNNVYIIHSIYVLKDYRGNSVGKKLIQTAEEWASKQGAKFVFIRVVSGNTHAIQLYKERGFKVQSYSMMKRLK